MLYSSQDEQIQNGAFVDSTDSPNYEFPSGEQIQSDRKMYFDGDVGFRKYLPPKNFRPGRSFRFPGIRHGYPGKFNPQNGANNPGIDPQILMRLATNKNFLRNLSKKESEQLGRQVSQFLRQNSDDSADQNDVETDRQNQDNDELDLESYRILNKQAKRQNSKPVKTKSSQKEKPSDANEDPDSDFLTRFQNKYKNTEGLFQHADIQPVWRQQSGSTNPFIRNGFRHPPKIFRPIPNHRLKKFGSNLKNFQTNFSTGKPDNGGTDPETTEFENSETDVESSIRPNLLQKVSKNEIDSTESPSPVNFRPPMSKIKSPNFQNENFLRQLSRPQFHRNFQNGNVMQIPVNNNFAKLNFLNGNGFNNQHVGPFRGGEDLDEDNPEAKYYLKSFRRPGEERRENSNPSEKRHENTNLNGKKSNVYIPRKQIGDDQINPFEMDLKEPIIRVSDDQDNLDPDQHVVVGNRLKIDPKPNLVTSSRTSRKQFAGNFLKTRQRQFNANDVDDIDDEDDDEVHFKGGMSRQNFEMQTRNQDEARDGDFENREITSGFTAPASGLNADFRDADKILKSSAKISRPVLDYRVSCPKSIR